MRSTGERFQHALGLAKQQLPHAFAIGGGLPYSSETRPLTPTEALPVDLAIRDDLLPRENEDLRDLEEANQELGFDAIAFYISFHKPTPEGKWGIFYWDGRIRQLAAKIDRDLNIPHPAEAVALAREIVRTHELFHFRFDVYSLHQELTLQRPLYNQYHRSVYAKVLCTADCYEESLANRACIDKTSWPKVQFFGRPVPLAIRKFLKDFCRQAPPGYRDFDRPPTEMKTNLGGQLLYANKSARLVEPQARWVGDAGPFVRGSLCPEYLLLNQSASPSEAAQLTLRRGGRIWVFHRYDPDPWPSQPHGHDREDGCKLSLTDGKIYDPRNRQVVGQNKRRLLVELRGLIEQKWPDVKLPELQN